MHLRAQLQFDKERTTLDKRGGARPRSGRDGAIVAVVVLTERARDVVVVPVLERVQRSQNVLVKAHGAGKADRREPS